MLFDALSSQVLKFTTYLRWHLCFNKKNDLFSKFFLFKSLNVNIPVLDMLLDSPDRIKQTLARYMNLGVHI